MRNNPYKIQITLILAAALAVLCVSSGYSEPAETQSELMQTLSRYKHKLAGGTVQQKLTEADKETEGVLYRQGPAYMDICIYFSQKPGAEELAELSLTGAECFPGTWTPPVFPNHPMGYMLARVPVHAFFDLLDKAFVKKVDTAERKALPQNNISSQQTGAADLWAGTWRGSGVRIAILDSGLDTEPSNPDLPSSFEKMDYSAYPTLDSNVENTVTGHGTHVAATVLGRGVLSAENTGNSGGAYKGMAPEADLIFLKIANDTDGTASGTAIISALEAAVSVYNADIITMSYGGWNDYHDGSMPIAQKVDWCFSQGVPVFISAGNDANAGRHYSGTVSGGSATGYIQVNVSTPAEDSTKIKFNLVWYDDTAHNGLYLTMYNSLYQELSDMTFYETTESSRGTESQKSEYNAYIKGGDEIYYLKITNPSGNSQLFHIYDESDHDDRVTFADPDPDYTISSPATADHAFAVGSWTSRSSWSDYTGHGWSWGESLNDISSFSSRGPRIDGMQKPDITSPGTAIISLRDRDVYTSPNSCWIDDNGTWNEGGTYYYVMQGTSMACPAVTGTAALLMQRDPSLTPSDIYGALRAHADTDAYTGSVPNSTWGYGKLNVLAAADGVSFRVKMFLEGPYSPASHTMSTALNSNGLIPRTSPYTEDAQTVSAVPAGAVDWILLQLRQTAAGEAVASKSVFISADGTVYDIDGATSDILFDVADGDYYIVVRHRNHLAVMSAAPVALSAASVLYDFTAGPDTLYGTNSAALLETGVYGMYSGDADHSEFINATDLNVMWRPLNGTYGYDGADMNMDSFINAHDKRQCYKKNMGTGSSVE